MNAVFNISWSSFFLFPHSPACLCVFISSVTVSLSFSSHRVHADFTLYQPNTQGTESCPSTCVPCFIWTQLRFSLQHFVTKHQWTLFSQNSSHILGSLRAWMSWSDPPGDSLSVCQSGACLSPRGKSRGGASLEVIRREEKRSDVGCELGSKILYVEFVWAQEHTSVHTVSLWSKVTYLISSFFYTSLGLFYNRVSTYFDHDRI